MTFLHPYALLLLRICLVVLFPFSALDKIINWSSAMKQAAGMPFRPLLLACSIALELVGPVCIVTGWHDRTAALVLAGFCALTAILFHRFWRFPSFWKFREGEGLQHFWEFLKNFALVGGLGLFALAPTTRVSEALALPGASTELIDSHADALRSLD